MQAEEEEPLSTTGQAIMQGKTCKTITSLVYLSVFIFAIFMFLNLFSRFSCVLIFNRCKLLLRC